MASCGSFVTSGCRCPRATLLLRQQRLEHRLQRRVDLGLRGLAQAAELEDLVEGGVVVESLAVELHADLEVRAEVLDLELDVVDAHVSRELRRRVERGLEALAT